MTQSDQMMLYAMSGMNVLLSILLVVKGSRYLSSRFDLRGRDRSCFVIPVAYGLAYFVMQMDWLTNIRASIGSGTLRDMAWALMDFAVLIYMSTVMGTNVRKRKARFILDDAAEAMAKKRQEGGVCAE